MKNVAQFRFYAALNDFLPPEKRRKSFTYYFRGSPSVKDAIQSLGVPHTEISLILANSNPVDFMYHIQPADRIAAYPAFTTIDISGISHAKEKRPEIPRFVADAHLGKLAKYLRMLGIDTLYKSQFPGQEIIRLSNEQMRVILTRDLRLLMHNAVKEGYFIRTTDPQEQIREVLHRFHLKSHLASFTRCLNCNGVLEEVEKTLIIDQLEPQTRRDFQIFYRCTTCRKIYWKGSHYDRMRERINEFIATSQ